jgi:hypothetical protein
MTDLGLNSAVYQVLDVIPHIGDLAADHGEIGAVALRAQHREGIVHIVPHLRDFVGAGALGPTRLYVLWTQIERVTVRAAIRQNIRNIPDRARPSDRSLRGR